MSQIHRRRFLQGVLGAGTLAATGLEGRPGPSPGLGPYAGPNLILIRFGGGARRRESIDPLHTFSPYLCFPIHHGHVLLTPGPGQAGRHR